MRREAREGFARALFGGERDNSTHDDKHCRDCLGEPAGIEIAKHCAKGQAYADGGKGRAEPPGKSALRRLYGPVFGQISTIFGQFVGGFVAVAHAATLARARSIAQSWDSIVGGAFQFVQQIQRLARAESINVERAEPFAHCIHFIVRQFSGSCEQRQFA